jgi:hypothetical protein
MGEVDEGTLRASALARFRAACRQKGLPTGRGAEMEFIAPGVYCASLGGFGGVMRTMATQEVRDLIIDASKDVDEFLLDYAPLVAAGYFRREGDRFVVAIPWEVDHIIPKSSSMSEACHHPRNYAIVPSAYNLIFSSLVECTAKHAYLGPDTMRQVRAYAAEAQRLCTMDWGGLSQANDPPKGKKRCRSPPPTEPPEQTWLHLAVAALPPPKDLSSFHFNR